MPLAARLSADLRRLGLTAGDAVLVRCATRPIAPRAKGVATALLDALLDVVGAEGTVVALTFTDIQLASQKEPVAVFTDDARTSTGGFSSAVLKHPDRKRSGHGTNSIAAIGAKAAFLTEAHGPDTLAFSWIERLIECSGKQLLIGCVAESPGLSTVHLTQERLGLSGLSRHAGNDGAFVTEADGTLRWVARHHIPGCSMGFGNMYTHYVRAGILSAGPVGEAYAIMANAADAAAIEHDVIAADPNAVLCDRPTCLSCASWSYSKRRLPAYAFARLSAKADATIGRLLGRKPKSRRRGA